ncbi:6407_t:CDS:2, partial [Acaulospora morrowiae]
NLIVAVDLLHIEPIAGVNTVQGDFTEMETQIKIKDLLKEREVDVVLSDMAPNFSGIHFVDHLRSMELCESSFSFAEQVLKPGGAYLCKFIMGGSEVDFRNLLKNKFEKVRYEKPQASHKQSTEGYY